MPGRGRECMEPRTGSRPVRARWVLGPLLLAMAVGQLADLPGFIAILRSYRLGPSETVVVLALALIAGELVAGIGLVRPQPSSRAAAAGVAVAVAWTTLGVEAFARGLALESCGCLGTFLAQPLRWWVLLEDAEFVLLSMLAWRGISQARPAVAPAPAGERVSSR